jgi:dodecin
MAVQRFPTSSDKEGDMSGSTYTIVELVGASDKSWEDAARVAIEAASESLRDLRVAEVVKLDLTVENGKVKQYRTRVNLSFKYEKGK